MKKRNFLLAVLLTALLAWNASAQNLYIDRAQFHVGDNPEWKLAAFDDSAWQSLVVGETWDMQGIHNNDAYAWYRIKFVMPESMLASSDMKSTVKFCLGSIDDADEAYLNGVLIGKTGRMPADGGGYSSAWSVEREYTVDAKRGPIRWGKENVLAVRVYNGGSPGGMYKGPVRVLVISRTDGLRFSFAQKQSGKNPICAINISNTFSEMQRGMLCVTLRDPETGKVLSQSQHKISLKHAAAKTIAVPYSRGKMISVDVVYTDAKSGKTVEKQYIPAYILTPEAPRAPRYNGPLVYGVRPESPVIFRIPMSGVRPMKFSVANLPDGLMLDAHQGVISGKLMKRGEYVMTLEADNAEGHVEQTFSIHVGDKIALTPPMGWNSWNCWGLSVSQEKVMSSAQAILDKGLADYGYNYINVDDAWEAPQRNADGTIAVNEKFADMKALGDWIHAHGLRFGIYSSPGDFTCGQHLGSLNHEEQDAQTYNEWGIDYLKYDWCGYAKELDKSTDHTVATYIHPYMKMERYLREQPRDIFYSLCQYGMANVWEWGKYVDANSWRTTGDIEDTWESVRHIGFVSQAKLYPYAEPGHWNDPDMLCVGKVGWGSHLRDTRLTPDEQYTHISLWSLLAANMLIGCDVSQIDDFTLSLLCNNEVNAVNQDVLGRQAQRLYAKDNVEVWVRELADGGRAVGVFNLGDKHIIINYGQLLDSCGLQHRTYVRDLWRQTDIEREGNCFIPTHGVKFLKVR